jgi:hypothetical protein
MFPLPYHCQDFYRIWLYIWVTQRVSYKKQDLFTLREHLSSPPGFSGVRVAHRFSFCFVLLCVFTFWIMCCDVRYDFGIKTLPQFSIFNINVRLNKVRENRSGNQENLTTFDTQDTRRSKKKTQHNMCWTPLYANKHK